MKYYSDLFKTPVLGKYLAEFVVFSDNGLELSRICLKVGLRCKKLGLVLENVSQSMKWSLFVNETCFHCLLMDICFSFCTIKISFRSAVLYYSIRSVEEPFISSTMTMKMNKAIFIQLSRADAWQSWYFTVVVLDPLNFFCPRKKYISHKLPVNDIDQLLRSHFFQVLYFSVEFSTPDIGKPEMVFC